MSDAYTSLGIFGWTNPVMVDGYAWIDSAVAMLFALFILVQGFRIVRQALAGIMDETDHALLLELTALIQEHRRPAWVT